MFAVNDSLADGPKDVTITLGAATSGDGDYSGFDPSDVVVTNLDDEVADVIYVEIDGSTIATEGFGSETVEVQLSAQPESNVVVAISNAGPADITVNPDTLTFTPGNWNQAQAVNIVAIDDPDPEPTEFHDLTFTVVDAVSADPFDGISFIITVTVLDNDTQQQAPAPEDDGAPAPLSPPLPEQE